MQARMPAARNADRMSALRMRTGCPRSVTTNSTAKSPRPWRLGGLSYAGRPRHHELLSINDSSGSTFDPMTNSKDMHQLC